MGVVRTTFVIDKNGKIAQVFEKVKPEGHDQQVLQWIKEHGN
jgi:peroxiredoxin Q/BCP